MLQNLYRTLLNYCFPQTQTFNDNFNLRFNGFKSH